MQKLISTLCCLVIAKHTVNGDNALRFFPNNANSESDGILANGQQGEHWALLVAGSNGWYNYRHQADACHAYQVLKKHGFPENRIITMMYDDIAHNPQNPTLGKIINHPLGPDVYAGVKIDYRQEDVTPANFLAVLSGNQSAVTGAGTGRVIKSGPNDHIFVNFVDHGAPGIIAFPSDELHAKDLMNTIQQMHKKNMYKQMVFYIEACESGSMFNHLLPKDINVYGTTAANPTESSYACYFDKTRETYLGDVYSVKWMEDSDKENLGKESLHKQFEIVKSETNTSHVKQYGDRTIATEVVAEFQSDDEYVRPEPQYVPYVPLGAVASGEVKSAILQHQLLQAKTEPEKLAVLAKYEEMVQEREQIETTMRLIVTVATRDRYTAVRLLDHKMDLTNIACYEPAARAFDTHCYDLSKHEFALRNLYALVNMCETGVSSTNIIDAIKLICG